MQCMQCETRGNGAAIYLHERRNHGLSQGARVLLALWKRVLDETRNPEEQTDSDMDLDRSIEDSGDDEHELPGAGMLGRSPGGRDERGSSSDSEDAESEGGARAANDNLPCRRRAGQETVQEIENAVEKEIVDLMSFLEIQRGVPGRTVNEIVRVLYTVATYGQVADPCGNPLRTVMNRMSIGSVQQRRHLYEGRFGPASGRILSIPGATSAKATMYIKPLSLHLKEIMSIDKVVQSLTTPLPAGFKPWYEDKEDFLHDFRSAGRFEAISRHLAGQPFIPIRVYGDGFSQNQIGPHRIDRNETYGIYCQLMTYPAHLSRNVGAWFTLLLADSSEVTDCRQLWGPIVQDIELLQEAGFFVESLQRVIPVVLVAYCGDLKDQNLVCGMAASGARFPHAGNLVTSLDRRGCTSYQDINPQLKMRNRADHNEDIEVFRRTRNLIQSRGAKEASVFDPVSDFIEHEGFLSCDIAHSFFLGVVKSDIGLALSVFMALGLLSENEIEGLLITFKKLLSGEEKSNFTVNVFSSVVGVRLPIKASISQARLLVKYSTLIFQHLETYTHEGGAVEEAWKLLVELHKTFLFVESFCLSRKQVDDFEAQLEQYINQRIAVRDAFEDITGDRLQLLPKHVDLLSAPSNFRATGSLVLSSTSVMESRNGFHKEAIQKARNRIHTVKTMGDRTELWEKCNLGAFLERDEIVPFSFGLPRGNEVLSDGQKQEILRLSGHAFAQHVKFHGKMLRSGEVIDTYVNEECKEIKTVRLLGVDCGRAEGIYFVVEDFECIYLPELDCYAGRHLTGRVRMIPAGNLCVPVSYVPIKMRTTLYNFLFTKGMIVPVV